MTGISDQISYHITRNEHKKNYFVECVILVDLLSLEMTEYLHSFSRILLYKNSGLPRYTHTFV